VIKDKKRLLIAGIDPGETKGYALIDIDCRLIKLNSSKKLTFESLMRELTKHGKVILIGTDVNPCPKLVKRLSTSLKAKLYVPKTNLLVKRKRQVNNKFLKDSKLRGKLKIKNKHQKDALAIAILALKSIKPLFNKIDLHLIQNNKLHLSREVKERVIVNKMPISKALTLTEKF